MKKTTKIYIAGHRGMVGSSIWRALKYKGYSNLIGKTSVELDLRNQQAVNDFYDSCRSSQGQLEISVAARPAKLDARLALG